MSPPSVGVLPISGESRGIRISVRKPPLRQIDQRVRQRLPFREQSAADEIQVENADDAVNNARRRDLEHVERCETVGLGDAVDDDVRRRADQGARSTQDRRERKRYQHFRRRDLDRVSEADHHRREDDDHRRVVGKDRVEQAEQHHHQQRLLRRLPGHTAHLRAQPVDHAGALEGGGEDEQTADRDRRRIAEHLQHVVGLQHAHREQRRGAGYGENVGGNPLADHAEDDDGEDDENQGDLNGVPTHAPKTCFGRRRLPPDAAR